MADVPSPSRQAGVTEKYVDMEDGTHALGVTIVGLETPVELTGDVVLDTFGALDDAAVTDPDAASATIPALLRGILETNQVDPRRVGGAHGAADDDRGRVV